MNFLPKYKLGSGYSYNIYNRLGAKILVGFFFLTLLFFVSVKSSLAASAYISPATGFIKEPSFLVSVYVESATTEPKIAGANINITYPTTVNVSAINQGDFDSYIEKSFDATTRVIKINAVNNAGNYKSGKVKLASIKFDTAANTGQVQLVIKNDSGISGEGGQQLLTETINGVYTIEIEGTSTGGDTSGTTGTDNTGTDNTVPETGKNDFLLFTIISTALIGLGLLTLVKPRLTRQ
jgi:hypothetical protein